MITHSELNTSNNKSLYRFYRPDCWCITLFKNNQVNCTHPRFMNDAMEKAEFLVEKYNKFCEAIKWSDKHRSILDNHAIACFSKSPVLGNSYMWEKYGDQGRGFAIEYDNEILRDQLTRLYRYPIYVQDVNYINGSFDLNDFNNTFTMDGRTYSVKHCIDCYYQGNPEPLERLFKHLRLVKDAAYWGKENESRIVIGNINHTCHLHKTEYGYNLELPEGTIRSITLGAKMKPITRKWITCIAKKKEIAVYYE